MENGDKYSVDESVDLLLKDEQVLPKVKIFSDRLNSKIASLASDEEDEEDSYERCCASAKNRHWGLDLNQK